MKKVIANRVTSVNGSEPPEVVMLSLNDLTGILSGTAADA